MLTADSIEKAKTMLRDPHERISVVLTDFHIPGADGTELLRFTDVEYGDIVTILVTACAGKGLLIQAVSTKHMLKILEKPYQPEDVRYSPQGALALRQDRLLRTQRLMAIDETLAFLAHELNASLAAISNFVRGIRMHVDQTEPTPGAFPEVGRITDHVWDDARYYPSVIAAFLNSVCGTYDRPNTVITPDSVGGLTHALFDTYPFTSTQHEWVTYRVEDDLPIQTLSNCMILVLSPLMSSALQVLRQMNAPKLEIVTGRGLGPSNTQHTIRIEDNGPGITSDVLVRLTVDPVTTRAEEGGSGTDMIFCTQIIQSFGGTIVIDSASSASTRVTLTFP